VSIMKIDYKDRAYRGGRELRGPRIGPVSIVFLAIALQLVVAVLLEWAGW